MRLDRIVLAGIELGGKMSNTKSNAYLDSTLLPVSAGLVPFPAARPSR